jgi:putative transposase
VVHEEGPAAAADCWDNAVVESFFASLKVERLHERRFVTPEQVEAEVGDYIERFYNRQRRHSTLDHVSPVVFELRHVA